MIPYKRILCIVTLLLCVAGAAFSQTRRQKKDSGRDFVYLSGSLNYQALLNDDPTLLHKPGGGVDVGVGYRMYRNHFLLEAGVEGLYGVYQLGSKPTEMSFDMVDSQNDPFIMHAYITNQIDAIQHVDVQIPLMIGGEWKHVYFLAGAKVGLNVFGSAVTRASLTATATYNRFADDFASMPNHQLYDNAPLRSKAQPLTFKPQVYGTAEIGYRLGDVYTQTGADVPQMRTRFYIAAFAQYGVLNMHKAMGAGYPVTAVDDGKGNKEFQVVPAYNTLPYRDLVVNNLFVGVKLTVAFEMPKTKICVICKEREAGKYRTRW